MWHQILVYPKKLKGIKLDITNGNDNVECPLSRFPANLIQTKHYKISGIHPVLQTDPAAKWSYNKIPNNEIVRAKSKQRFTEQRNLKSATVNRRSISREN